MANTFQMIGRVQARSLEEFSDAFRSALVAEAVNPWAATLGMSHTSGAIKTTYPLPVYAVGYQEFKGDVKYRSLFTRSLSITPKEWQDGVAELARIVEAGDFIGWGEQPAAMAEEAQRAPNDWLVAQLEANPFLDLYRDDETGTASARRMFADDHPHNVFDSSKGSFDNDLTASGIDSAMMTASKLAFRSIKDASGRPLGLQMTHLLVPAALEEEAKDFLEQDMLIQAVKNAAGTENVGGVAMRNRHANTVQLVVSDELTADDVVYPLALNKPGLFPWIIQTNGAPEEIIQDKGSYLYQTQKKLGIAYFLEGAASLALPHPIQRVTIS